MHFIFAVCHHNDHKTIAPCFQNYVSRKNHIAAHNLVPEMQVGAQQLSDDSRISEFCFSGYTRRIQVKFQRSHTNAFAIIHFIQIQPNINSNRPTSTDNYRCRNFHLIVCHFYFHCRPWFQFLFRCLGIIRVLNFATYLILDSLAGQAKRSSF